MRTSRRTVKHLRANNEARCRRILDRSELLEVEDLDWTQAGAVELDGGMLDTLVYMRDVEGFTDSYVAGIGAHRTTLSDPIVADFLVIWQAEEAVHSQAIARFLDGSWTPVGVGDGYKTVEEFQRVLEVLNSRPESEKIIDRMDRRFAALPGFERLRIYRQAATPAAA